MQYTNSNLSEAEIERMAYANGDVYTANLYAQIDDLENNSADMDSAATHIKEAIYSLPGEDFLVCLMEKMRSMAIRRITKQDMLDLINDVEDLQNQVHGGIDYARGELYDALKALAV